LTFGEGIGKGKSSALPYSHAVHLLGHGNVAVSFEFLPPHTPEAEKKLWRCIKRLAPLNPVHIAITSGGDQSTRQRTNALISQVRKEIGVAVAPHITCRNNDPSTIRESLREYWKAGARQVVAIRGDSFNDGGCGRPIIGYNDVVSLIRGIRNIAPFDVIVAAYPEKHPLAPNMSADLDALKRKIDAGATSAITQYFFNNDHFFRFIDRARAAGITIPITPGVLPIYSLAQVMQISEKCNVSVPSDLIERLGDLDQDSETRRYEVAAFSAEQILNLVGSGVTQIHFFTLNRADLVFGICHMIGLRASETQP
jgi:methylenetetrahydrofolate reductase (NADPH)